MRSKLTKTPRKFSIGKDREVSSGGGIVESVRDVSRLEMGQSITIKCKIIGIKKNDSYSPRTA